MSELDAFHRAVNDPSAIADSVREKNAKIIGYLCSYAPVELIHAAGFHPMRLFSAGSEIVLADSHLQSYCCSLVRGVLENSLSGKLDFLDGTLFPHTCDSIQRLSDIWRMNGRYSFFADLVLPVKLSGQSSRNYMIAVLERLKIQLEKASGKKLSDDVIASSTQQFNTLRQLLERLYQLVSDHPGILSGRDLHAVVKGAMIMDVDDVIRILPGVIDSLTSAIPETPEGDSPKRILLTGSICDAPDVYTLIEAAGGRVVSDDLCTGRRWFHGEAATHVPPIEALADRYLERIVCPAKHRAPETRSENLIELSRRHNVDGVVFMLLKFCDPHAFDYPHLKEALEGQKIRTLLIEMDDQAVSHGQISTRIETFVHMLP